MATLKLGHNCRLYRNSAVFATPTWVLVANVKDVNLNIDGTEIDATTRLNNGWKATEAGLLDAQIEVQMPLEPTDVDFAAFQLAFTTRAALDIAITDGGAYAALSGQDFRARVKITAMSEPQPIDDGVIVVWTMRPCYDDNPPTFVINPAA